MQDRVAEDYDERDLKEAIINYLAGLSEGELRSLAEENGIDISALTEKSDIVDAISLYPGIARILDLGPPPEPPETEEEGAEESEGEKPADDAPPEPEEEAAEEEPQPGPQPGKGIQEALSSSIDFSELEQLLSEAAARFGDGGYDGVLAVVQGAADKLDKTSHRFLEAGWAYGIMAVHRMLESSEGRSSPAKDAKGRLEEAQDAFKKGDLIGSSGILEKLVEAGLELHSHEMERAREDLSSHETLLADVRGMGGEVTHAASFLANARQALDNNDRSGYLKAIAEVDRFLSSAKETRIGEIREASKSVSDIVEEATSIGADVEEASTLLEQVKDSIKAEDFVSANELVSRAEFAALESQKAQMDKVVALRERQLTKAKELMAQVKPLLDKARRGGFQTQDAMADLKSAAEYLQSGDYVNALMRAKRAHRRAASYTGEAGPAPPQDVPEEPPEESPTEPPEVEEAEETTQEEPQPEGEKGPESVAPICPRCGSEKLDIGRRGKAKCSDCGNKFKISG